MYLHIYIYIYTYKTYLYIAAHVAILAVDLSKKRLCKIIVCQSLIACI